MSPELHGLHSHMDHRGSEVGPTTRRHRLHCEANPSGCVALVPLVNALFVKATSPASVAHCAFCELAMRIAGASWRWRLPLLVTSAELSCLRLAAANYAILAAKGFMTADMLNSVPCPGDVATSEGEGH